MNKKYELARVWAPGGLQDVVWWCRYTSDVTRRKKSVPNCVHRGETCPPPKKKKLKENSNKISVRKIREKYSPHVIKPCLRPNTNLFIGLWSVERFRLTTVFNSKSNLKI